MIPVHSPVIEVVGSSAVLRFSVVNANPPVSVGNVRWLLSRQGIVSDITNNTMIDDSAITFESNSTAQMFSLTINNVQSNYTSRFIFTAKNPAGMDSNFISLIVEGIIVIVTALTRLHILHTYIRTATYNRRSN